MATIRPALTRTHLAERDCLDSPTTRLWIEWAERHGFAWRVARCEYYNMRSSFDDPLLPSRHYWELHVEADPATDLPDDRYMTARHTLDEAIAMTDASRQYRAAARENALTELANRRDEILSAYRGRKTYPRSDRSYVLECLGLALRGLRPTPAAAGLLSSSDLSWDAVVQAIGVTCPSA